MKRIITSIVILALLAAISFWSVFEVNRFADGFLSKIDEIEDAFENGDIEKSGEHARELSDNWNRFMEYAVLVNDLGHALEITSSIAEIYSFAQEGNEELYAACDRASAQLEMFKDMQNPTFWKIL